MCCWFRFEIPMKFIIKMKDLSIFHSTIHTASHHFHFTFTQTTPFASHVIPVVSHWINLFLFTPTSFYFLLPTTFNFTPIIFLLHSSTLFHLFPTPLPFGILSLYYFLLLLFHKFISSLFHPSTFLSFHSTLLIFHFSTLLLLHSSSLPLFHFFTFLIFNPFIPTHCLHTPHL